MHRTLAARLLELVLLVSLLAGSLAVLHAHERGEAHEAARSEVRTQISYLYGFFTAVQTVPVDPAVAAAPVPGLTLKPGQSYLVLRPDGPPLVHGDDGDHSATQDRQVMAAVEQAVDDPRGPVDLVDLGSGPGYVGSLSVMIPGQGHVATHVVIQPLGEKLSAVNGRTIRWSLLALAGLLVLAAVRAAPLVGLYRRTRARAEAARARPATAGAAPDAAGPDARRPLGTVVVEGFSSRLAFGILSFTLPLYAYSLGMSLSLIGLLLATNMAVAAALKPLMGAVIDRVGVRQAYIVAVVLRTLVILTLVLATGPAHLFLARALHGVAIALRDPASATVLAALGGKKAVAQRFAWFQTVKTVSGSAGQFSAGVLLTVLTDGFSATFLIAALLSGIPLVIVLWGLRGPLVQALVLPQPPARTPLPTDLRRALLPYAGLGAMMTGTAYLMSNLLPVLAVEHMGLAPAAAGSLYLLKSVISFTGPVWGWLADRVSLRLVLGVRALGNALSSVIWLVAPGYPGLLAGKVADDVGKAAFAPAWGAVMAKVSALDPPRRARVLARMSAAEDVGEMAGPVVAGLVWTAFGLPAVLVLRLVLALATEGYALVLGRRTRLDEPEQVEPPQVEEAAEPAHLSPGAAPRR